MIARWIEIYSTEQPLGIEIALDVDQLTFSPFIQLIFIDKPATLIRHLIDSLCGESFLNSTIFRFSESSAGLTTEYTTVKQNTCNLESNYRLKNNMPAVTSNLQYCSTTTTTMFKPHSHKSYQEMICWKLQLFCYSLWAAKSEYQLKMKNKSENISFS